MNIRKIVSVLLLALLIFALIPGGSYASVTGRAPRVEFEGQRISFEVEPQVIQGRTFVQYRPIAQAIGATINWEAKASRITVRSGNANIVITVGNQNAVVNGRQVKLDAPARIKNGHLLVPLRFVGESLGHEVHFYRKTNTIVLNRRAFVLRDSDGAVHVFDKAPTRIIALSRSIITILHGLGITPTGIHDTRLPLPAGLENVARVGLPHTPDIERITALSPDLVIASTRVKAILGPVLARHRIRAVFRDTFKFEDTIETIEMFGRAFDKSNEANRIIADMRNRQNRVVASVRGKTPPRVMVLFGTAQAFMFATEDSYVGDLVRILNGINVVSQVNVPEQIPGFIPFSIEQAVALNPQVILRISHGNPVETLRLFHAEFRNNPIWRNVDAVRNNRVYDLDSNLFDPNPGLQVIDALEELAKILYE